MKKQQIRIVLLALGIFLFFLYAQAAPQIERKPFNKPKADSSQTLIWAGIDYSLAKFIGKNDGSIEYGFNVPDVIFPKMIERWNQMFLDERIQGLSYLLRCRILIDVAGVAERNKSASEIQIISENISSKTIEESHISADMIQAEVQSYKMENTNGLALVFIVDRFAYGKHTVTSGRNTSSLLSAKGAVYVVIFDANTRKVISTKRKINTTSSAGNFQNFWFGPIKDAEDGIKLPK